MTWIITAVGTAAASSGVAFTIGSVGVTNLGLYGAAAAIGARGMYTAGKQQEIDMEIQADQEKLAAEGKELGRRQELNKALAANVVGVSTSGMSGEGTPASISLESAKQASASEGLIALSDTLKQAQLKRRGKNANSSGKLAAASSLLQSSTQIAKLS